VRELRAALCGLCAFAVVYPLVGTLRLPVLTYDPVARTIDFTAHVDGLAMRYFGELAWACVAGSCAAAAVWSSRRPRPAGAALAAAALVLAGIDVAFYLSRLLAAV
jgi:hypothetical protein